MHFGEGSAVVIERGGRIENQTTRRGKTVDKEYSRLGERIEGEEEVDPVNRRIGL